DLVVAAEDAKFGIPEAKRGLVAAGGGLLRLQHRIPRNIAMEFALTGDFVDAPRLAELGLVNSVEPSGGALDGAKRLAARIAENAPLAVAVSKQVINESEDWSTEEMWTRQDAITGPVFVSHDAMEGAAAFAEKRKPNWKGAERPAGTAPGTGRRPGAHRPGRRRARPRPGTGAAAGRAVDGAPPWRTPGLRPRSGRAGTAGAGCTG